ncbi:MAG: ornithine cyclodeaminase family protein [Synergistaceae bacterium]|jgi:ornithine cyclodeaminase/alanine dehydrogenase|nr:ornithine cyclodeaminase family protein [Synergistaceae bacterium]
MSKVLLLTEEQVKELITMKEVVDACEKTFRGMGEDRIVNPTKVTLDLGIDGKWPGFNASMNAMPAYIGWQDIAGIKWIGGWYDNPSVGLPFLSAMILLIEGKTGKFLAAMEGNHITNMRTGAQSAVAMKYLTEKRSIVMGLYGAGVQGRTQAEAFAEIFRITDLRVYDISPEAGKKFKSDMEAKRLPNIEKITICGESKGASEGCDAVVSVSHGKDKHIKNEWIKPGAVVFPMGSNTEAADDLILGVDKIIVDHIGQTLHRGALKDVVDQGKLGEKDIYATIGEVVTGRKKGLENDKQRIVCVPIGTGAMDISTAGVVYKKAIEKGLGQEFAFTER